VTPNVHITNLADGWKASDSDLRRPPAGCTFARGHAAQLFAGDDKRHGTRSQTQAAGGQCHVDWMAWGGVVSYNQEHIESLAAGGRARLQAHISQPRLGGVHHGHQEKPPALPHVKL